MNESVILSKNEPTLISKWIGAKYQNYLKQMDFLDFNEIEPKHLCSMKLNKTKKMINNYDSNETVYKKGIQLIKEKMKLKINSTITEGKEAVTDKPNQLKLYHLQIPDKAPYIGKTT